MRRPLLLPGTPKGKYCGNNSQDNGIGLLIIDRILCATRK